MSVFSTLEMAPRDPILGLTEAFVADSSPDKVNLGVGVYLDEKGAVPLMACVRQAEQGLASQSRPRGYLPMTGMAPYNTAVQELVFGENSSVLADQRVATLQSVAGTGALRVGAGLLKLASPNAKVLLSNPSWENHELIFTRAGFTTGVYRYYDSQSGGVDVDGMIADLSAAEAGTIVLLHASCHNPTGCDLTQADWDRVVEVIKQRHLVPFVDMAYQGFAHGLVEDCYSVTLFAESGIPFVLANSFSKNFALYGERIGAVHFICADQAEADRTLSQAKLVVRAMYSNPPTQGAAVVTAILTNPELRASWDAELAEMRDRIKKMRVQFRSGLEAAGVNHDLSYITTQEGLFSYSGLSVAQMERLRSEYHIYGLDSGRLCIAGLNEHNMDRVVTAVAEVMGS
ncbi:MAG: aspartate/tyrosine/aromatic aminotransferase [Propionibacteriaceae bacterium]|jgi:aromatic-amino-acid transaminase|nr:aspartate/tyrosine/aromatic aminotransferase [Propionibacteriaceae bacterium]